MKKIEKDEGELFLRNQFLFPVLNYVESIQNAIAKSNYPIYPKLPKKDTEISQIQRQKVVQEETSSQEVLNEEELEEERKKELELKLKRERDKRDLKKMSKKPKFSLR